MKIGFLLIFIAVSIYSNDDLQFLMQIQEKSKECNKKYLNLKNKTLKDDLENQTIISNSFTQKENC
jgi:azurin